MSNQAAISRRSTLLAATTLVTATALPAVTSIAQTGEEKCDCALSLPDQTGASGAHSNSAIAMMPPGEAVPASEQEQVLGVKIARSSFAKAPTIGSAFPEMRMRSAMFLCALIPWACNG